MTFNLFIDFNWVVFEWALMLSLSWSCCLEDTEEHTYTTTRRGIYHENVKLRSHAHTQYTSLMVPNLEVRPVCDDGSGKSRGVSRTHVNRCLTVGQLCERTGRYTLSERFTTFRLPIQRQLYVYFKHTMRFTLLVIGYCMPTWAKVDITKQA